MHHTVNYLRRAPLCPVRESEGETRCKFSSHNRVYTVPCSVFLCPVMCRAASCFLLFSLCLLLPFVLISGAKVQTYLQPAKHFTKNLCLFNVLQQISIFLPKFIHILSTKTGKCAIYKANFFAFAEYPHTYTHVHYIKTNNKLYLQPLACVLLCGIL